MDAAVSLACSAQATYSMWHIQQRTAPDWENPSVFSINQRNAHVPLRSSLDAAPAAAAFVDPAARRQTRLTSLGGSDWAFKLVDKPELVPEAFASPDFDTAKWCQVSSHAGMHLCSAD